jgi:hypothetical protein
MTPSPQDAAAPQLQLRRRLRALLLALVLPLAVPFTLVFPAFEARAISEAEALRKLAVIRVFVITDAGLQPVPIPRDRTLVLPLYLERARAERELASLRAANPGLQPRLVPLPLSVANERVIAMRGQLREGWTLVAPLVPRSADLDQARALLRSQGVSEERLRGALTVPVFFTRPFLTVRSPQGVRAVFFFSYDDLRDALARLPKGSSAAPQPQVADLTAVLREIVSAETDGFLFHPSRETLLLQQGQRRGTTPPPPPPPPPAR